MAFGRFPPDGLYGNVPYRVLSSGEIVAIINGQQRHFATVETFIHFASDEGPSSWAADSTENLVRECTPEPPKSKNANNFKPKNYKKQSALRSLLACCGIFFVLWIILEPSSKEPTQKKSTTSEFIGPTLPPPKQSEKKRPVGKANQTTRPDPSYSFSTSRLIVDLLNSQYGGVCEATLEGWFSKTLKIDWTSRTTKLHALKILAEIGSVKERLYADGVRYFKFPNNAGGYNIIDWRTGEKTSVNERARYYFSN